MVGHTGTDFEIEIDQELNGMLISMGAEFALQHMITNAIDATTTAKSEQAATISWNEPVKIVDYGDGLNWYHFALRSDFKERRPDLIGKNGIGLNIAFAIFNRHGIQVVVESKHIRLVLDPDPNEGISDIVKPVVAKKGRKIDGMVGTKVIISGCSNDVKYRAQKNLNDNGITFADGILVYDPPTKYRK